MWLERYNEHMATTGTIVWRDEVTNAKVICYFEASGSGKMYNAIWSEALLMSDFSINSNLEIYGRIWRMCPIRQRELETRISLYDRLQSQWVEIQIDVSESFLSMREIDLYTCCWNRQDQNYNERYRSFCISACWITNATDMPLLTNQLLFHRFACNWILLCRSFELYFS